MVSHGNNSFPRVNTIKSRREFDTVMNNGLRVSTQSLTLSVLEDVADSGMRIGIFLAGKFPTAVKRNLVKRVIREYLRTHKSVFPEKCGVVTFASKRTATLSRMQLREELDRLFYEYKSRCN